MSRDLISCTLPRDLWEEVKRRAARNIPTLTAAQLHEILVRQGLEADAPVVLTKTTKK